MQSKNKKAWWLFPALVTVVFTLLLVFVPGSFGVKPVYLWTDKLIFILIVMLIFMVAYIRQRDHLRAPWGKVLKRKMAMAALIILIAYVIVGLLDSVHFRKPLERQGEQPELHYSVDVLSLLDVIAMPLKEREEKTYSAPFATHLYSREAVEFPDGSSKRIYPRLKYGGAHLGDIGKEKLADIVWTSFVSIVYALIAWGLVFFIVIKILASRNSQPVVPMCKTVMSRDSDIPWSVLFYTLLGIFLLVSITTNLGVKYHILGTDKVGQDVLYLAIKSIRTGLVIGTLTTLVMLPFAVMLGIAAGYFKGWIDDVIQYLYTTLNSIPGVLLIAAAILSIQVYIANHPELIETGADRADLRLLALCIILGVTSWTGLCRLLRGESMKVREMEYIQSATAFGVSHLKIILRHILPNVTHIVLIIIVLDFSGLVLAEAVLSYVGVGVDPSTISWGNMINSARLEMAREPMVWWSLAAAFVFMFTLVLAANLFSDAVRDAFDPRLGRGEDNG